MQQLRKLGYYTVEFPRDYRKTGKAGVNPHIDNTAVFTCPACDGIRFWERGGDKLCARCHPPVDNSVVHEATDGRIEGWCYSKAALRATTNKALDVFAGKRSAGGRGSKRVGGYYGRGYARWHWFGDTCVNENRKGKRVLCRLSGERCVLRSKPRAKSCDDFVNNGKWNPHLNVLVDVDGASFSHNGTGFVPEDTLEKIQNDLREALDCPDLIVHYSYRDTPGKMVHAVRYVTRSTFRNRGWNDYMASELYNYRNARWWGTWKDEKAWGLEAAEQEGENVDGLAVIEKLCSGACPDCGEPLKVLSHNARGDPVRWTRAVDAVYLSAWGAEEIAGTGYYRIPHREWQGDELSPDEIVSLERLAAKAKREPSVNPFARAMAKTRDELWRMTRAHKALRRREQIDAEDDDSWWQAVVDGELYG